GGVLFGAPAPCGVLARAEEGEEALAARATYRLHSAALLARVREPLGESYELAGLPELAESIRAEGRDAVAHVVDEEIARADRESLLRLSLACLEIRELGQVRRVLDAASRLLDDAAPEDYPM